MEKKYVMIDNEELDILEEEIDEFFMLTKKEMKDRIDQFIHAEFGDEKMFAANYSIYERVGDMWKKIDYREFL